MDIEKLASRIKAKRKGQGVRQAAEDAKISSATLSRIENGKIPDLETFEKLCAWLGDDPATYLDTPVQRPRAQVHFKKESAIRPDSAKALGEMISLAHKHLMEEDEVRSD